VQGVRVVIEQGAVAAVIEMTDGADETQVKKTLDRFAITWRMEKS
jgi:fatty-acyl-CoA synthase